MPHPFLFLKVKGQGPPPPPSTTSKPWVIISPCVQTAAALEKKAKLLLICAVGRGQKSREGSGAESPSCEIISVRWRERGEAAEDGGGTSSWREEDKKCLQTPRNEVRPPLRHAPRLLKDSRLLLLLLLLDRPVCDILKVRVLCVTEQSETLAGGERRSRTLFQVTGSRCIPAPERSAQESDPARSVSPLLFLLDLCWLDSNDAQRGSLLFQLETQRRVFLLLSGSGFIARCGSDHECWMVDVCWRPVGGPHCPQRGTRSLSLRGIALCGLLLDARIMALDLLLKEVMFGLRHQERHFEATPTSPSWQMAAHTESRSGSAGGFFLLIGTFPLHCCYMHAQFEGLLQKGIISENAQVVIVRSGRIGDEEAIRRRRMREKRRKRRRREFVVEKEKTGKQVGRQSMFKQKKGPSEVQSEEAPHLDW
ncbi:hypothetical protein CHARACLAT_011707 [Characodon lateralis]|uniref:Uncharacterized protein n=1 Tax=Characodon lateralis TaxID=208331 RepID=A0ABU7F2N2_9TELE|nr:hypothetical protein [Characodon lateralis]